jgi:putative transposase
LRPHQGGETDEVGRDYRFFLAPGCRLVLEQPNIQKADHKRFMHGNLAQAAICGTIFHSDRGSRYCSNDFRKMPKIQGMISSMSRKGNCWDNSVAERFFGSLKTERAFFSNYKTREEAPRDIVDYIEMFYNSNRRHAYLSYLSPKEFEETQLLEKNRLTKVSIFS